MALDDVFGRFVWREPKKSGIALSSLRPLRLRTDTMKIKNTFRTLFNIRVERALPPPGPQPPVGSSIVRGSLRIHLKVSIDSEQWEWFSKLGWRTTDMRKDRRRYVCLQDKTLLKLLKADEEMRECLQLPFLGLILAIHIVEQSWAAPDLCR